MDWMQQLGGMLDRYRADAPEHPSAADDFDEVTRHAPRSAIASGLAAAFRSQSTPPFPQLVKTLFSTGDFNQRAGLLNVLLPLVSPGLLAKLAGSGRGILGGFMGGVGRGNVNVSPDQAMHVEPDIVQQMAEDAERRDPSIVERVTDFAASQPQLVKALGTPVLGSAISRILGRSP